MGFEYADKRNSRHNDKALSYLAELPACYQIYYTEYGHTLAPKTLRMYLERHLAFFRYLQDQDDYFTIREITSITPEDISRLSESHVKAFLNQVSGRQSGISSANTSRTTVSYAIALNSIWHFLLKIGILCTNPAQGLERTPKTPTSNSNENSFKEEQPPVYYDAILSGRGLTPKQKEFRQKQHTTYRDFLICSLLGQTNIRMLELIDLDITDVDLDKKRLAIHLRNYGETSIKYLDIPPALVPALQEYLTEERPWHFSATSSDALFLIAQGRYKGQRLGITAIERLLKKYALACGD